MRVGVLGASPGGKPAAIQVERQLPEAWLEATSGSLKTGPWKMSRSQCILVPFGDSVFQWELLRTRRLGLHSMTQGSQTQQTSAFHFVKWKNNIY